MNTEAPKRVYRQSTRALAAEATGERILDGFAAQLRDRWFDEIRLEDVARDADVTVQTVIRRFGGKEGLLNAMRDRMAVEIQVRRTVTAGDIQGAIAAIVEDYEATGDLIIRVLAQEERYDAIHAVTDYGRASHREWIEQAFLPWLDPLDGDARRFMLDALVVACDVYIWKLIRRDMARPLTEYRDLITRLCATAIGRPFDSLAND